MPATKQGPIIGQSAPEGPITSAIRRHKVHPMVPASPLYTMNYPDPWADPKSRSTLGFYNLHHRSTRVQNIYLLDPPGGLGIRSHLQNMDHPSDPSLAVDPPPSLL